MKTAIAGRLILGALSVGGLLTAPLGAQQFGGQQFGGQQFSSQQFPSAQQQQFGQQPAQPSDQLLSPQQLDTLVAPVALYPDPLLGEVFAASTYPLELIEAQQWIRDQRNLSGAQIIEAAKQQNWDPSVQALVAFPEVLALLTRDVRWTTDLGNAFLSQQSGVMAAVQQMRARAESSGALRNTPQQTIDNQFADNGQDRAIAIQPADPGVMYVPNYNPSNVWGPPASAAYPLMYSPPYSPAVYAPSYPNAPYPSGYPSGYAPAPYSSGPYAGSFDNSGFDNPGFGNSGYGNSGSGGSGIGFGLPVLLSTLFSGLTSFGGWGWVLNWVTHGLFLNGLFLNHFGFGGGGGGSGFGSGGFASGFGGGYGGNSAWVHNPAHRLGVAYPSQIAGRFSTGRGFAGSNWRSFGGERNVISARFSSPSSSFGSSFGSSWGSRSGSPSESNAWRGWSGGNRGFAGSEAYRGSPSNGRFSSSSYASSYGGYGSGNYGSASRGYGSSSFAQGFRQQSAPSYQQGYRGFEQSNRGFAAASQSSSRASSQRFSEPRASGQHFSQQRVSQQHFSAPHFSAPHSSSHSGGGHFSAPHGSSHAGGGHGSRGSGKHH